MKKRLFEILILVALSYFSILYYKIYIAFESTQIVDVKIIDMPNNCGRYELFTVEYYLKTYQKKVGRGSFCENHNAGDIIKMRINPDKNNDHGNVFFVNEYSKIELYIFPVVLILYIFILILEFYKPSLFNQTKVKP